MLNRIAIAQCVARAAELLDEGMDPEWIAVCLRNLSKEIQQRR